MDGFYRPAPHAANSGQHQFEQTFYLAVEHMVSPQKISTPDPRTKSPAPEWSKYLDLNNPKTNDKTFSFPRPALMVSTVAPDPVSGATRSNQLFGIPPGWPNPPRWCRMPNWMDCPPHDIDIKQCWKRPGYDHVNRSYLDPSLKKRLQGGRSIKQTGPKPKSVSWRPCGGPADRNAKASRSIDWVRPQGI